MKRALSLLLLALAAAGCAHAIKNVSDCDRLDGLKRVECGACTLPNKADGYLGEYEYRPDNAAGERCVRVKWRAGEVTEATAARPSARLAARGGR